MVVYVFSVICPKTAQDLNFAMHFCTNRSTRQSHLYFSCVDIFLLFNAAWFTTNDFSAFSYDFWRVGYPDWVKNCFLQQRLPKFLYQITLIEHSLYILFSYYYLRPFQRQLDCIHTIFKELVMAPYTQTCPVQTAGLCAKLNMELSFWNLIEIRNYQKLDFQILIFVFG